ncbi:MAG: hypothetical protein RR998_05805 [Oscillospiraceae bacterium]
MINGKLKQFKTDLGLREEQGILYGEFKGYIITVTQKEREFEFFVDARLGNADSAITQALREFVKGSSHDYKLASFRMESTGTSIVCARKNGALLLDFIYIFMAKLAELGVPGKNVCSNCGQPVEHPITVRISSHAHSCDSSCVSRLISSSEASRNSKSRVHGSFIGFVGAILGCIVALVLYIFLAANGYFSAGAAVLLPVFAGLGYTLLGGARSVAKGISVIVLPLVLFAIAVFGVLCALVYNNWHDASYVFSLSELVIECFKALKEPYVMKELIVNQFGVGCMFIALGWIFALPDAFPKKSLPRISELGQHNG